MSSYVRRIQRQVVPSQPHHEKGAKGLVTNPGREVSYLGRGSKLGVRNPLAKDLLARLAREERNN